MTEEQYNQAETFWTRKDEKGKKMDPEVLQQWIEEFLSDHKVLALATAADDFIRCTPLEYGWHDGALWIFTEGGLKFKSLRKNKHVAAAIFAPNISFGNLQSMQIEGEVELPEVYGEEYNQAAAWRKIPLETLKKLAEPMWLLKITPTEITCLNSDFKKDGYDSRQIWKAC